MSLYISKVSEGLIQHVSVKKCQDEHNCKNKRKEAYHLLMVTTLPFFYIFSVTNFSSCSIS